VGVILPAGATHPAYTIAVMTNAQQSMPYGITTIEGVAVRVHSTLHP
jgi:hypothetical protein